MSDNNLLKFFMRLLWIQKGYVIVEKLVLKAYIKAFRCIKELSDEIYLI